MNPQRLALQRWYEINAAAPTIPIANAPYKMTFDGLHVWVATKGGTLLTKVRANDASVVGTATGGDEALVYDGAFIWSFGSNGSARKIRASDATTVGTFSPGGYLTSAAFDGSTIWVTDSINNLLKKIDPATGTTTTGFTFAANAFPEGVLFDGQAIWVTTRNEGRLRKLRPSDGFELLNLSFPTGQTSGQLVFDGEHVWVATTTGLVKVRASDGTTVNTISFPSSASILSLAFDGEDIWAVTQTMLRKVAAADGTSFRTVATLTSGINPRTLLFDGANVWVSDFAANTLKKY